MSEWFERAWRTTHDIEAGYVNHPNDPGGETNHGVTVKVARAHGYKGDMRDLTEVKALEIGKKEFWDRLLLDEIAALSPSIALELFDTNMNLWYGAAGKFLQTGLNSLTGLGLVVDGEIGARTIAALKVFLAKRKGDGELVLLNILNAQQCVDYMRQVEQRPTKRSFFFGWVLKRVRIK